MLAILAANYWTASGNFPLIRTLLVTVIITIAFAMPSLWASPTFFSAPLSLAAAFYLPFWLSAFWFGYRLDVKEAWTIITIHWPFAIAVMFFIYLPICWSIEREYEEKQRRKREMMVMKEPSMNNPQYFNWGLVGWLTGFGLIHLHLHRPINDWFQITALQIRSLIEG